MIIAIVKAAPLAIICAYITGLGCLLMNQSLL